MMRRVSCVVDVGDVVLNDGGWSIVLCFADFGLCMIAMLVLE